MKKNNMPLNLRERIKLPDQSSVFCYCSGSARSGDASDGLHPDP